MKFIVKEPGKKAKIIEYEDTVDTYNVLKSAVGGYIELVYVNGLPKNIDMFCNETGKLNNLAPNINIGYDVVVGTVIFARHNRDGDTIGLTDSDIADIEDFCNSHSI